MALAITDRYRLERELGQGGMATVYLAQDVKHDRRVAIKVLRPEVSATIGAERFLQEIKTTATLQHPHIVSLFDSGEAGGTVFYVMPYVEGETLRERLRREQQLSVDDAVRIAREVASALDYAHRHGVIHRDIKPENILLHDGRALVTDFGIALAIPRLGGGSRMTETGLSLGTPQYMSPEQATSERVVDARTDVYALGCVLYEMLAGEPPISGPTTQAIIARLMTEDPRPLTVFRKTVSPALEAAIFKALAKLPADRFATVAGFAAALNDPAFDAHSPAGHAARRMPQATLWRWRLPVRAALAVALAALAVWGWLRPRAAPPVAVNRFVLSFPPGEEPGLSFYGTSFTLSRDGSRIAYIGVSQRGQRLLVRSRDQLRATPVPGTENVYAPAFSPDGQSLAFVTGSPGALRVVALTGGTPVTLVADGVLVVHVSWSTDGFLYYTDVTGALARVSQAGGAPQVVARPDTTRGQRWFTHPDLAPHGKVLFTIWPSRPNGVDAGPDIAAVPLPAGQVRILAHGMNPHTDVPGQLVFADRDYNLLAAPFDSRSVGLTGPARSLGVRVAVAPDGSAQFALSPGRTLLYASEDTATQRVAWLARDGRVTYVDTTWTSRIISLALSPDGKRLAVGQGDRGGTDIWVKTLDRGPLTRLTHWGSQTYRPGWAPDGRSLTFVSNHDGIQKLFAVPADGSGAPTLLFAAANGVDEGGWSPDGRWLIVRSGVGVRRDIVGIRPGRDSTAVSLVATQFEEFSPALSPDGHWIAYVSDETTRPEVYVRPFPQTATARWQVSAAGGQEPVWGPGGRELYYRNGAGDVVAATITSQPTFRVVSQRTLFSGSRLYAEGFHQTYAVAPDGRFLFVEGKFESSAALVRVDNWIEETK